MIIGSLSNHDDDGNKDPTNLHIWQWKTALHSKRFARAFFIFWHFEDALVLSRTWNDLFCSCVDDVSIWWQMLNFVCLCPKRWFQFNSRIVRPHFSSIMTLNIWKMVAEISDDVLASVDVVFALRRLSVSRYFLKLIQLKSRSCEKTPFITMTQQICTCDNEAKENKNWVFTRSFCFVFIAN